MNCGQGLHATIRMFFRFYPVKVSDPQSSLDALEGPHWWSMSRTGIAVVQTASHYK